MVWELTEEDKNKPLTISKLNEFYKDVKENANKDPEFYHMSERYYMELYIHQIAENMLSCKKITDLAIIFRKIHNVDYPRYFS